MRRRHRAVNRRPRLRVRWAATLVAVAVAGASGVLAAPSSAAPPAAAPVAGGPSRLPVGTHAVGALAGDSRLSVDVALRPSDPAVLEAFDQAVTDPASPEFRHFLAPGQFAARFGPGAAAVSSVRAWLSGAGLVVGPTARDGLLIGVSGSASQLGRAFGVGFEQERLPSGRIVREPTGRPAVPVALSGAVRAVLGLDDLSVATPQMARPRPGPHPAARSWGSVPHAGPAACGPADSAGMTAPNWPRPIRWRPSTRPTRARA